MANDLADLKNFMGEKDARREWVTEMGEVRWQRLEAMALAQREILECLNILADKVEQLSRGTTPPAKRTGRSSGKKTGKRSSGTSSSRSASRTRKKKPSTELDLD